MAKRNHSNGAPRRRKPSDTVKVKAHLFEAGAFKSTEIDWYWPRDDDSYDEQKKQERLVGWRNVESHFYVPDVFLVTVYAHPVPGQEGEDYPEYDRWALIFSPHNECQVGFVIVQSIPDLMDLKARWWPMWVQEHLEYQLSPQARHAAKCNEQDVRSVANGVRKTK
jgi:hypothetical protein